MPVKFQGNEHLRIDVEHPHCIDNATHVSFVKDVSLSRMHKEDGEPGLSVWWVKKYDHGWVWRKQTFHKRDHGKPQWFIHQGWWTTESILELLSNVVTTSALLFFVSLQRFSSPQNTGQFLTLITTWLETLMICSWKRNIWMALQTHTKRLRSCCKFLPIKLTLNVIEGQWLLLQCFSPLFQAKPFRKPSSRSFSRCN